jgi:hypothetical protein
LARSVSGVAWDETGDKFGGVAGINAEYKIDALMSPRIARGLLMDPPAIHSTSMTVLFEFEFSHPDLVEQGRFWQLLGDEVEGEIVRLIVTKVQEYWEASLVFQGADRLAKQIDDDDEGDGEDFQDMSVPAELSAPPADPVPPANSNQEKTMKLTMNKNKSSGLSLTARTFPRLQSSPPANRSPTACSNSATSIRTIAELRTKADAGDKFIELQRDEVTRLAKLAELGADEGDLPSVITKQIEIADFDTLVELETYYEAKVRRSFRTRAARRKRIPPRSITPAV